MAVRPVWRGHLRLALVGCPVSLHSVLRASGDLHFHFINPKTGHRVRTVTLDAETDKEVPRSELVRGYEFEKDRYVLLDDKDFSSARVESSSTMTVEKLVARDVIHPIYFDNSYYVVPDGAAGQDVYIVLRDAIAESKVAALSRVVIARRERSVAILPIERGLMLHTLHEPRDLYAYDKLFEQISDAKPDGEMVKLVRQLIERQEGRFEPADIEDRYEARLREVIEAKLKGEGIEPEAPEEPRGDNVIDLMAALKPRPRTPNRYRASPQGVGACAGEEGQAGRSQETRIAQPVWPYFTSDSRFSAMGRHGASAGDPASA